MKESIHCEDQSDEKKLKVKTHQEFDNFIVVQIFWPIFLISCSSVEKERKFDASNVSNICTCEFNLIWGDNLNWLDHGRWQ